jgi:hypothetical protein
MEVIELRNPKALMVAEIQGLFKRMTERVSFAAPGGFDSIAPDLYRYVTSDGYFVLLGFEDGSPKALAMGFFPADNIFPYPTITVVYNEGSPGLVQKLGLKLLDTLMQRGYSRAWAINASGKPDRAWQRLFRLPGKTVVQRLGSVMEFRIE